MKYLIFAFSSFLIGVLISVPGLSDQPIKVTLDKASYKTGQRIRGTTVSKGVLVHALFQNGRSICSFKQTSEGVHTCEGKIPSHFNPRDPTTSRIAFTSDGEYKSLPLPELRVVGQRKDSIPPKVQVQKIAGNKFKFEAFDDGSGLNPNVSYFLDKEANILDLYNCEPSGEFKVSFRYRSCVLDFDKIYKGKKAEDVNLEIELNDNVGNETRFKLGKVSLLGRATGLKLGNPELKCNKFGAEFSLTFTSNAEFKNYSLSVNNVEKVSRDCQKNRGTKEFLCTAKFKVEPGYSLSEHTGLLAGDRFSFWLTNDHPPEYIGAEGWPELMHKLGRCLKAKSVRNGRIHSVDIKEVKTATGKSGRKKIEKIK